MGKKRIFISTGEVSGDLQGSLLVESLKKQGAKLGMDLEIVALGGDRMAKAGAKILGNTTRIGSVGIFEHLIYVLPTLQVQRLAKDYLARNPPDLTILIDYMGPNIGIGNYVRQNYPSIPIVYYIAPQEWVWSLGDNNTNAIVGFTDLIVSIFPAEEQYYREKGAKVAFLGHPLVDRMANFPSKMSARQELGVGEDEIVITLFPASRKQELKYLLPAIFSAAKILQNKLTNIRFFLPLSREDFRSILEEKIASYGLNCTIVSSDDRHALAATDLAITKSGTVNLELALLEIPQIVLYAINPISAWIARKLLKFSISFMSPPNLVNMRKVVPELVQEEATCDRIVDEAMSVLMDTNHRQNMLDGYQTIRQCLGEVGVCDRVAEVILNQLPQVTIRT